MGWTSCGDLKQVLATSLAACPNSISLQYQMYVLYDFVMHLCKIHAALSPPHS